MYRRVLQILVLAGMLAILNLATVRQANAQMMYVSKLNNLCLAVNGGRITNGSTMITWTCVPNDPSQTFYPTTDGFVHVGSAASQFCIASFNGQTSMAQVGVWQCTKGTDGKAHFSQAFNYGMWQDLHIGTTNLCLNVQGGNRNPGTPIILYQCSSGTAAGDMWVAQRPGAPAPAPQPPPPPAAAPSVTVNSFHLVSGMGSRCLGVQNSGTAPGTPLIQWDCMDKQDQTFSFLGNGQIALFGGQGGLCLDEKGGLYHSGDQIIAWPCSQSSSRWTFANGRITSPNGLCVDLYGGWAGRIGLPNQWAQLYACNNQPNQAWVAGLLLPRGNSINPIQPGTQIRISGMTPSIISHNGSAIIASGAGNIIASGAGNIIASGAGNIIASGAGNVLVPLANGIIASGAGN